MQAISGVLEQKQHQNQRPIVTTGINKVNTIVTTVPTGKLTRDQVLMCDTALMDYSDLISGQFKEWYCKMFYTVGAIKFQQLASIARADGKNKPRYFSYLLKQEVANGSYETETRNT